MDDGWMPPSPLLRPLSVSVYTKDAELFFSQQLLVLTGVRYLQTAMENVLRLGDPDSESDGWILENSLAETARSNFNIIKNLGKCYQTDNDPNINVPTPAVEQEVPSQLRPEGSLTSGTPQVQNL
ncbi:hypothetical protein F2P81_026350 [Scophthalmus maximus]|uniref:Uncharacterized protein n=1 Tax=Scophthalmus maximus TaxID=52904 RepID=A0A6A4RFY9_SCOMX|nr:hypothetical protein F2P81_026350 [Scophthalmus maximus]